MKSKDKTFRKKCYIEIFRKKKKIYLDVYLSERYCDQPIKKFEFNDKDTFILKDIYGDIIIQDYENSSS